MLGPLEDILNRGSKPLLKQTQPDEVALGVVQLRAGYLQGRLFLSPLWTSDPIFDLPHGENVFFSDF